MGSTAYSLAIVNIIGRLPTDRMVWQNRYLAPIPDEKSANNSAREQEFIEYVIRNQSSTRRQANEICLQF